MTVMRCDMCANFNLARAKSGHGRLEQKERERKWAASNCQCLYWFLPPKKKKSDGVAFSESSGDSSLLAPVTSTMQPPTA